MITVSPVEKDRTRLEAALLESEEQFKALFETSPIPFFLIDASELSNYVKSLLDIGVQDFGPYFKKNPEELVKGFNKVRFMDLNQAALTLIATDDKNPIIQNPTLLLPLDEARLFINFVRLIARGEIVDEGFFTAPTLEGKEVNSIYRWSVLPTRKNDYARVILSMVETTTQKKAEKDLQFAVKRLETIHKIETGILAAESPQAIAEIALEHIENIVPCLSSAVSLLDSNLKYSVLLAGLHIKEVPGDRTPLTPSPIWDMLKRGQTVVLNDLVSKAKGSKGLQTAVEYGGRAILIVPLLVQGEIIGVINLLSNKVDAFEQHDKEVVRQIADSVAIAMHNAQLLETEQKARREADTLREVASKINARLDQEELLDQILTQLALVIPYNGAAIFQYKRGVLSLSAQQGVIPEAQSFFRELDPIPQNMIQLIKKQQPVIIADTHDYPEWVSVPGAEIVRSWLGVPLMARDSFIGLLMLDKWEPNFYSDQSANLALAFANQAAITIENAQLYHETQQYAEQMERQVVLRTRDLSALYDITAATSQYVDLQSILDIVISKISTTMDCPTVIIQTIDPSGKALQLNSYKGFSPTVIEYLAKIDADHEILHQIINSGEPVMISNVQTAPTLADIPIRHTITHTVGVPIRAKDNIVGILGVATEQPLPFSREDIALLTSIADHIGIAIENDRLRKQAKKGVITEERERLARDLHDSATQSLFSLTLFAAAARELVHTGEPARAERYLDDIATTANQTHKEMRLLLYELRPSALAKEGLAGALRLRLETVENRSGIDGHFSDSLTINLPAPIEAALFQVANEALNNTLRHAKANEVFVIIQSQETQTMMEIRDNGVGFQLDSVQHGAGMGLANMQQRMAAVGGTLEVHSTPGQGTTIIAAADIA